VYAHYLVSIQVDKVQQHIVAHSVTGTGRCSWRWTPEK